MLRTIISVLSSMCFVAPAFASPLTEVANIPTDNSIAPQAMKRDGAGNAWLIYYGDLYRIPVGAQALEKVFDMRKTTYDGMMSENHLAFGRDGSIYFGLREHEGRLVIMHIAQDGKVLGQTPLPYERITEDLQELLPLASGGLLVRTSEKFLLIDSKSGVKGFPAKEESLSTLLAEAVVDASGTRILLVDWKHFGIRLFDERGKLVFQKSLRDLNVNKYLLREFRINSKLTSVAPGKVTMLATSVVGVEKSNPKGGEYPLGALIFTFEIGPKNVGVSFARGELERIAKRFSGPFWMLDESHAFWVLDWNVSFRRDFLQFAKVGGSSFVADREIETDFFHSNGWGSYFRIGSFVGHVDVWEKDRANDDYETTLRLYDKEGNLVVEQRFDDGERFEGVIADGDAFVLTTYSFKKHSGSMRYFKLF